MLTQAQIVMKRFDCDNTIANSYNLLQNFFIALDKHDTKAMKKIIYSTEKVGSLMHKTFLTFRHNLKAVLNDASFLYFNCRLEGFTCKIKQIERTIYESSNFTNLLIRIRLEETGPNNLLIV